MGMDENPVSPISKQWEVVNVHLPEKITRAIDTYPFDDQYLLLDSSWLMLFDVGAPFNFRSLNLS